MDTPQPAAVTQEDIHAWLTEIRDLKNTVAALRNALEQARIDRDKAVQDAIVTANHEIVQLRSAASALRDALELERQDKERSVQDASRTTRDEIQQLKATVATLRDQLEATRAAS